MTSLKYRSDIDGLRAVAVLGVVIYHAFPHALPGGFTGVDIFFVISGYLISGILYKGLKSNGRDGNVSPFSFGEFYARRIRRLFPALITVLVLTMTYGWLILLPDEFRQLGKHVAAGTLFIQNMVFWQECGYFDTAASLKPLLHLWSLAVEEQFYISFPLVLILLWKRPRVLVPVMGVLLIATFILNVVMSVQNRAGDFFLTPYRVWEFMGGSLLAWWHYNRGHAKEVPLHREALSWGGLILLALGFTLIHTGDPYPGWRAMLPVAGTLLLIEGDGGAWVNRKVLSNSAVVWIGLISYPLYLFHWPALAFVYIVKGENPKSGYLLAALGLAFVLTIFTYHFIEKRIRHNKSKFTLPLLIAAFLFMGALGTLVWQKVLISKPLPNEIIKFKTTLEDKDSLRGLVGLISPKSLCLHQIGGTGATTLFFGDSNMQHYAPRIVELLKRNHGPTTRGALLLTGGGCPPMPEVTIAGNEGCLELFPKFDDLLEHENGIDRIVIAARWDLYFSKDTAYIFHGDRLSQPETKKRVLMRFGELIHQLVAQGKKVTVILSTPNDRRLDPRLSYKRDFIGSYSKNLKPFSKHDQIEKNGSLENEVATVAKANGARVIDPLDFLCIDGICIAENEDGPIRYDINHLRPGYVREHVKYLDQTVAP